MSGTARVSRLVAFGKRLYPTELSPKRLCVISKDRPDIYKGLTSALVPIPAKQRNLMVPYLGIASNLKREPVAFAWINIKVYYDRCKGSSYRLGCYVDESAPLKVFKIENTRRGDARRLMLQFTCGNRSGSSCPGTPLGINNC